MNASPTRATLRRELEVHLTQLGYTTARARRPGTATPEVVRVSPLRGRIVYGETVLRSDLQRRRCHERLLSFSQRRTRRRSTILFFIAVAVEDQPDLEALLQRLEIRSGTRGGHVHVVPIVTPPRTRLRKSPSPQDG